MSVQLVLRLISGRQEGVGVKNEKAKEREREREREGERGKKRKNRLGDEEEAV